MLTVWPVTLVALTISPAMEVGSCKMKSVNKNCAAAWEILAYREIEDWWANVILDVQRRLLTDLNGHVVSWADNLASIDLNGGETRTVNH